jgi:hypothetical protein
MKNHKIIKVRWRKFPASRKPPDSSHSFGRMEIAYEAPNVILLQFVEGFWWRNSAEPKAVTDRGECSLSPESVE